MTTTDEARVTDEQLSDLIEVARKEPQFLHCESWAELGKCIVELAYRLTSKDTLIRELHELGRQDGERIVAMERERAEMVALLAGNGERPCPRTMDFASLVCQRESEPCWEHRRRALLAKLRGSP